MKLCQRKKFTLLELLICISIITILAAILLPVLSKAKLQAQKISCLNNLSNMGKAANMYMNDNKGYLSAYYNNGCGLGDPGNFGKGGIPFFSGSSGKGMADYLQIKNQIGIGAICRSNTKNAITYSKFTCPGEKNLPPADSLEYYTIGYNSFINGHSSLKGWNFPKPSKLLLFGDRNMNCDTRDYSIKPRALSVAWNKHSLSLRHNTINFVNLGGNAESIPLKSGRILMEKVEGGDCDKAPSWHAGKGHCSYNL